MEPYIRTMYDEEQVKVCAVCHCLAFKVNTYRLSSTTGTGKGIA